MPKKVTKPAVTAGLTAEQSARLEALKAKRVDTRLSPEELTEIADLARIAMVAEKAPRRIVKTAAPAPAAKAKKAGKSDTSSRVSNAVADGNLVPLKAICKKLDIDPKRARVVLRRRLRADELPPSTHSIGKERWNLTPAKAERVREALRDFLRAQA